MPRPARRAATECRSYVQHRRRGDDEDQRDQAGAERPRRAAADRARDNDDDGSRDDETHASTRLDPRVRERPSIAYRDEYRDHGGRRATTSTVHAIHPRRRTPEVSRRCQSGSGTGSRATTAVPRGARRRHSRLPPATDNRSPSPASPPPGRMFTSPVPSSSTRSSTKPSTVRRHTSTERAPAVLQHVRQRLGRDEIEHSAARFVRPEPAPPRVEPAPGRTRPSTRSRRQVGAGHRCVSRRRARSARRGSAGRGSNASGVLRRQVECIRAGRRDERARLLEVLGKAGNRTLLRGESRARERPRRSRHAARPRRSTGGGPQAGGRRLRRPCA